MKRVTEASKDAYVAGGFSEEGLYKLQFNLYHGVKKASVLSWETDYSDVGGKVEQTDSEEYSGEYTNSFHLQTLKTSAMLPVVCAVFGSRFVALAAVCRLELLRVALLEAPPLSNPAASAVLLVAQAKASSVLTVFLADSSFFRLQIRL